MTRGSWRQPRQAGEEDRQEESSGESGGGRRVKEMGGAVTMAATDGVKSEAWGRPKVIWSKGCRVQSLG